jgi:phosphoribosylglycinamide formyltransferase-1
MLGEPAAEETPRRPGELSGDKPRRLPIAVLISGQGTNLNAILKACELETLAAEVRLVISNRPGAPGLRFGHDAGVATAIIPRAEFPSRDAQHRAMLDALVWHGVELVVLAGFDQILSDEFVQRFSGRILNVHPSLLPAFGGGMHAVRDALDHGVKITGVTVHFIAADLPDVDTGPILLQEAVPVLEDDTEESLLARIHTVEHRLLPNAIQLVAERRVVIAGRRTRILPHPATDIISRSATG